MSNKITLYSIKACLTQKLINQYAAKERHLCSEIIALQYHLDTLKLVWESLYDHPNPSPEQVTTIGRLTDLYATEIYFAQLELE
jgi:hypothetical protein